MRRKELLDWLEHELPAWFGVWLLPIDAGVADSSGRLQASAERTLPAANSLLAATTLRHHLRLVARNTAALEVAGLETIDLWGTGC